MSSATDNIELPLAVHWDPRLNDFACRVSSPSLIYNDSFLTAPMPNTAVFQQPISALIMSPPPALSSYSVLSPVTSFQASALTSPDKVPAGNQTALPRTPEISRALPFPPHFLRSTPELLTDSPLFSLNDGPFRALNDATLPLLPDSGNSPVVRRSQGDITPVFGRGGEVIHVSDCPKSRRDIFHDSARTVTYHMELSPESHSPSLRKCTTPFLQRLHRCRDSLSPSKDTNPGPCLASPFILKTNSTQVAYTEKTSTTCTSHTTGTQINSCAERTLLLGLGSSPLSEASSTNLPTSIIPLDLRTMFEEEDQKHRMTTRSRVRLSGGSLQSASDASTLGESGRQTRKRKHIIFQDDIGSNRAIPSDIGSYENGSLPMKRRDTSGGIGSQARRTVILPQTANRMAGLVTDSLTNRYTAGDTPVLRQAISDSDQADVEPLTLPTTPKSQRTFPSNIPINPMFPMFYRQFPISSYFYPESIRASALADETTKPAPIAQLNHPRDAYDLYTPRFTRGRGKNKRGLCPICFESIQRGGANRAEWLSMKVSAYKCYHMQYAHGISPTTGLPFSPPIAFCTTSRPLSQVRKHEKSELLQGKCHKCDKWVAIEGVRTIEIKVKELYWWKHAASCHKATTITGEQGIHYRDKVFFRLWLYKQRTKLVVKEDVEGKDEQ